MLSLCAFLLDGCGVHMCTLRMCFAVLLATTGMLVLPYFFIVFGACDYK